MRRRSGTQALAVRALRVDAIDGAEAAIAAADRLVGRNPRVRLRRARVPWDLPHGRWQRILASELAYYLLPHQIEALADALVVCLAPGGELITVHHVVLFDDAKRPPSRAVALLHRRLARQLDRCRVQSHGLYIVARWRRNQVWIGAPDDSQKGPNLDPCIFRGSFATDASKANDGVTIVRLGAERGQSRGIHSSLAARGAASLQLLWRNRSSNDD